MQKNYKEQVFNQIYKMHLKNKKKKKLPIIPKENKKYKNF